MRTVARRDFRPRWQRSFARLLVVLLMFAVLSHAIPAAECTTGGGKIVLFRGTQRQEVDFSAKTAPPIPTPPPSVADHPPADAPIPEEPRLIDSSATWSLPNGDKSIWEDGEIWRNDLRPCEDPAAGMPPGNLQHSDPPPPLEPTLAAVEVRPDPAAHPADPKAAKEFSALEIISLSVGISFGLSLLAIWLVVIAIQQVSGKGSAVLRNEPPGQETRQDLPASACQGAGQTNSSDRQEFAERRDTRVVDLAHDPLRLVPVANNYLQQRQDEQKRRNDQQTAILERIYQENVALQLIPLQPTAVQGASG